MFQLPSVVTMTIAATRMYRSLTDFASCATDMYQILTSLSSPLLTCCRRLYRASSNLPKGHTKVSNMQWNVAMPVDRIEVTVDSTDEQYQISGTSRHDPYSNAEEQLYEKPQGYESGQEPRETRGTRAGWELELDGRSLHDS